MEMRTPLPTHEIFLFHEADACLTALFPRVSRTFALTVPELPAPLRTVVMNAYLLGRILDTIEDDTVLTLDQKFYYGQKLVKIIETKENIKEFALELAPKLAGQTRKAELELIQHLPLVIGMISAFSELQQKSIERCMRLMWNGMQNFLKRRSLNGLETMEDVNDYCYHAAGVVGEMLTELFADYSDEIAKHSSEMQKLAISFGRGLQITNFLYDHWEDRQEGLCWFPRDLYKMNLTYLKPENYDESYEKAQTKLASIAHENLREALQYTLLIPESEPGIRRFCYWAIILSVFALRRIEKKPSFSKNAEIKIPRTWVMIMILMTRIFGVKDQVLIQFFNLVSPKFDSTQ
ncbi:squalene/phytoene synthase family protein [Chryseobacterium sp. JUb7]|uniref:squalene/phytoene synthase family protein n=1 Tax=Chryseobacterium sp. JUb7 TaxID=2940599 RepID=UPI00216826AA|nr:squalene/phytoene synthase family protein [Chryseobacterium sp. JUb7]MCS3532962.1 farnesyl-diphosphate farnesyltransferase [Chryseobacterium sp. JUb7]